MKGVGGYLDRRRGVGGSLPDGRGTDRPIASPKDLPSRAIPPRPFPGQRADGRRRARRRGFTLIELMVAVAIIALLLVIIGAAWRSITESSVEAKAINTITSYASVARAYAMRHQLETVLTVDPETGQLDMFVWDTVGTRLLDAVNGPQFISEQVALDAAEPGQPVYSPANSEYVYAPVLDGAARLPRRGENLAVRIVPIDYQLTGYVNQALARFCLCFDPHGRVVQRELTLVWQPYPGDDVPDPNISRVVALRKGWVGADAFVGGANEEKLTEYHVTASRGGIAYAPVNPSDNPYDPGAVPEVDDPAGRTEFMLNQYSGRVMTQEVAR